MMDIAEIRKKAKALENKGDAPAVREETFVLDSPGEISSPAVPGVPADNAAGLALSQSQGSPVAVSSHESDGLDRLFAAVDAFSFAGEDFGLELSDEERGVQAGEVRQYLTFRLSDEEYALDIARISEIIKVRELTEVPRCPEFVLGVISLRGVIVPVYDLCRRLKLGVSDIRVASRIVVCKADDMTVGFLVDSINQVVSLGDAELEPPPGVLSGLDRDMLTGIGRHEGRMIILLNLQSVLDIDPT